MSFSKKNIGRCIFVLLLFCLPAAVILPSPFIIRCAAETAEKLAPKSPLPPADEAKKLAKQYRTEGFQMADGIEFIPCLEALFHGCVFDLLSVDKEIEIDDLVQRTGAKGPGYLAGALAQMAQQGWIEMRMESIPEDEQAHIVADNLSPKTERWFFKWTPQGKVAVEMIKSKAVSSAMKQAVKFLPYAIRMVDILFHRAKVGGRDHRAYEHIVELAGREWDIPDETDPLRKTLREQILRHLDGVVVGPTNFALGRDGIAVTRRMVERAQKGTPPLSLKDMKGALTVQVGVEEKDHGVTKKKLETRDIPMEGNEENLRIAFRLLAQPRREWVKPVGEDGMVIPTPLGVQALRLRHHFGVPAAYNPTMLKLYDLMFVQPDPPQDERRDAYGREKLLDRLMNTEGSHYSHEGYFQKEMQVMKQIFDQDFADQPEGLVDVGCGQGGFLVNAYKFITGYRALDGGAIRYNTKRGELIAKDPVKYGLKIVGVDFNVEQVADAGHRIVERGVPAGSVVTIQGNVRDPDKIAADLKTQGVDLANCLSIRSSLDHNRPWQRPKKRTGLPPARTRLPFAHRGMLVSNAELEQDLVEHFQAWAKYWKKHGAIIVELHGIEPELAAQSLGKTSSIAYYGSHNASDQYIVPFHTYQWAVEKAGMEIQKPLFLEPNPDLQAISISHLKVPDSMAMGTLRLPGVAPQEGGALSFDQGLFAQRNNGKAQKVPKEKLAAYLEKLEKFIRDPARSDKYFGQALMYYRKTFKDAKQGINEQELRLVILDAISGLINGRWNVYKVPTPLREAGRMPGFYAKPGEVETDLHRDASDIPFLVRRIGSDLFVDQQFFDSFERDLELDESTVLLEALLHDPIEGSAFTNVLVGQEKAHAFANLMTEMARGYEAFDYGLPGRTSLHQWLATRYPQEHLGGFLRYHPGPQAAFWKKKALEKLSEESVPELVDVVLFLFKKPISELPQEEALWNHGILQSLSRKALQPRPSSESKLFFQMLADVFWENMDDEWKNRALPRARSEKLPLERMGILADQPWFLSPLTLRQHTADPRNRELNKNIFAFLMDTFGWHTPTDTPEILGARYEHLVREAATNGTWDNLLLMDIQENILRILQTYEVPLTQGELPPEILRKLPIFIRAARDLWKNLEAFRGNTGAGPQATLGDLRRWNTHQFREAIENIQLLMHALGYLVATTPAPMDMQNPLGKILRLEQSL